MKIFVAALAVSLAIGAPAFAQPAEPAAAPAAATKEQKPISYFYGIFQGTTTVVEGPSSGTEAAGRMSRVETESADADGFTITWSTVYIDEENPSLIKIKDSTVISFTPTATPGVYQQKEPGKLWTGKPYYWARIDGDTLNVSALVLDADGTYDVTHYARTVQADTMRLDFTRFKDGLLQRHVSGTLTKTTE